MNNKSVPLAVTLLGGVALISVIYISSDYFQTNSRQVPKEFRKLFVGKNEGDTAVKAFIDSGSGLVYYVESDGRHVCEMDAEGRPRALFVHVGSGKFELAPPPRVNDKPVGRENGPGYVFANNDDETIEPLTFWESESGVIYYVESDGRHISAIGPGGQLLWHRNPYVEVKLESYRYTKPVICYLGLDHQGKLGISYNSSQFGRLDKKTGDFEWGGQD